MFFQKVLAKAWGGRNLLIQGGVGGGGDKIDIYHLGHHKALRMSYSIYKYWETKQ